MPVTVLGISALYHDSAAAIVRDGRIVAAAQEERFSRKKHDPRFPRHAINYCLEEAFVEPEDLDAVVFYDNLAFSIDRVVKSLVSVAPRGEEQWLKAAPPCWASRRKSPTWCARLCMLTSSSGSPSTTIRTRRAPSIRRHSSAPPSSRSTEWANGPRQRSAAATARASSCSRKFAIPTRWACCTARSTYFCGFRVNSGEYKLMGLAPYGEPKYARLIRDHLIDLKADGSFRLNTDYFSYLDSNVMTNQRLADLFGGPPRQAESQITRREMDLAASIQKVLEEAVVRLARHARELTGLSDLTMAGGVALNCVANGVLLRERIFDRIWIQPAAGDAGGALGAALLGLAYEVLGAAHGSIPMVATRSAAAISGLPSAPARFAHSSTAAATPTKRSTTPSDATKPSLGRWPTARLSVTSADAWSLARGRWGGVRFWAIRCGPIRRRR